jgi:hypothetical protein
MLFPLTIALTAAWGVTSTLAVTPSDLPECAIECYVDGIAKSGLTLDDYEGQCRSAKFQLGMRGCAALQCEYDEYIFVSLS